MSDNFDDVLESIMARKQAKDRDISEAREAEARKANEKQAKQDAAKKLWQEKCFPMIREVIKSINKKTESAGIAINVLEENERVRPAIARVYLALFIDGRDYSKKISLNVNALGTIQLAQFIPQSAQTKEYHVETLSEEEFREAVVNFLDSAIEK